MFAKISNFSTKIKTNITLKNLDVLTPYNWSGNFGLSLENALMGVRIGIRRQIILSHNLSHNSDKNHKK